MQLRGTVDDIVAILNRAQAILPQVKVIALDPAFPDVVTRVRTLYDGLPTTTSASSSGGSVRSKLATLIKPLDYAIYAQRNPWTVYAVLGGAVALIGLIGYRMGQRSAAAR